MEEELRQANIEYLLKVFRLMKLLNVEKIEALEKNNKGLDETIQSLTEQMPQLLFTLY